MQQQQIFPPGASAYLANKPKGQQPFALMLDEGYKRLKELTQKRTKPNTIIINKFRELHPLLLEQESDHEVARAIKKSTYAKLNEMDQEYAGLCESCKPLLEMKAGDLANADDEFNKAKNWQNYMEMLLKDLMKLRGLCAEEMGPCDP